ncbi:pyridoxal phosphate-dependent aminotransferase [Micromonospora sp. NPDC049679]|uniref:pyridoxal phosphate-dependent aminotransferase n=1 Tax=Micromonospora sp. NPDC049679 TaxID=3155920 RepID=UPI0034002653
MPSISRLPEFRLEVYFSRWEFAARHHLTASDAQTMTVRELLGLGGEEARDAFDDLPLGYVETWGGPGLRDAVADTYDNCDAGDVLAFAGAQEAIFWAMQVLAGAGDHVIVTVPNYQSMETVPRAAGAEVTGVPLDESDGWRLDLDAVRAAFRPNTTLVAVNFPNNPTGYVPDQATWRGLVALCEERGVRLLADEVYRGLELDPARRLPQAAELSTTALSINVLSKSYGLPGLRVGWIVCRDRAVLARLERHKHYTSICNAAPAEHLAAIALRARDRIWDRNREILRGNLALADSFFAARGELFDWRRPDGGCVAFPRYRGPDGVESFCTRLVEEAGVLLLPASIYASELGRVPTDRFRIGLGRRSPEPAFEALDRFLRRA